jgi:hypothetical protein
MLGRRLLLFVVLLVGLAVVAAAVEGTGSSGPSVMPIEPAPPPGVQPGANVQRTLDAAAPRPQLVTVQQGDHLTLTVDVEQLDTVEISGLDQLQAASPDSPADFDILADAPGSYPIVLSDGREIATLRVSPRPS